MFLTDKEIRLLITEHSLITNYVNLDEQIQPNGFDLTLDRIHRFHARTAGEVRADGKDLPPYHELEYNEGTGLKLLGEGCYFISFNETVKLPSNVLGIGRTRSTLLRSGASIHTGAWDSGYEGKSGSLLVVHNPAGIVLQHNARVLQLLFSTTSGSENDYAGSYQFETA